MTEEPFDYLQYWQDRAEKDYKKSYYAGQKTADKLSWLSCYFEDLKQLLKPYGITKEKFLDGIEGLPKGVS